MPTNPPSAAAALYPHLQRDDPPTQQRAQKLETLYPRPQPKPPSNPYRDALRRNLQEAARRK
jgi:hypothetical protein